jgi:hypothetical protein
MATSYLADFHTLHHEFRIIRDEALQNLGRNSNKKVPATMNNTTSLSGIFLQSGTMPEFQPIDFSIDTNDVPVKPRTLECLDSQLPTSLDHSRKSTIAPTSKTIHTNERKILSCKTPKSVSRSRKGHTKSRRGCFNCKQRKIKVPGLHSLQNPI